MAVRGEVYSNLSSFTMGEPKGALPQMGPSPSAEGYEPTKG